MRVRKSILALCLGAIFSLCSLSAFEEPKAGPSVDNLSIPLGLPPIPWPKDNTYSFEKAELGKLLFFDKRLSSDGTVSCSSCHNLPCAFTDNLPVSIGIHNHKGTRHAPSIINSAYSKLLFWDGRAASLEEQCKGPIGNPNEMTTAPDPYDAHIECAKRVRAIPGYVNLFKMVFGSEDCSIDQIADAIATFERTILSGNSSYDKYIAGDKKAMNSEQIRGLQVFNKSGCSNCHFGPNFTNGGFSNIGIGMDKENPDLGRYIITHKEKDWGAFKVPGLREVSRTYPYMHDGSLKTLEDVIEYYDKGGIKNKNLHPQIRPLHLTIDDKKALFAFLHALNGEGWQHVSIPEKFPD